MVSNLERAFILKALDEGARLDERSSNAFREVTFHYHPIQRGHVTVHLGRTRVLAMVTCTLTRPYADRPAEGNVNYFLDMTPLSLPLEEHPEWEEAEGRIQRHLDRILKNTRTVDTESLCVIPGEQVWSVRVDVKVLDHDGALLDAAVIAVVAALTDSRRPEVSITEEGVIIHTTFEKNPIPLALHNPPIAVSFVILDVKSEEADLATKVEGRVMTVVDPIAQEEDCGGGLLTMAINRNGEVAMLVKTGGEAIDMDIIQNECLYIARSRSIAILDAINAAIIKTRGK